MLDDELKKYLNELELGSILKQLEELEQSDQPPTQESSLRKSIKTSPEQECLDQPNQMVDQKNSFSLLQEKETANPNTNGAVKNFSPRKPLKHVDLEKVSSKKWYIGSRVLTILLVFGVIYAFQNAQKSVTEDSLSLSFVAEEEDDLMQNSRVNIVLEEDNALEKKDSDSAIVLGEDHADSFSRLNEEKNLPDKGISIEAEGPAIDDPLIHDRQELLNAEDAFFDHDIKEDVVTDIKSSQQQKEEKNIDPLVQEFQRQVIPLLKKRQEHLQELAHKIYDKMLDEANLRRELFNEELDSLVAQFNAVDVSISLEIAQCVFEWKSKAEREHAEALQKSVDQLIEEQHLSSIMETAWLEAKLSSEEEKHFHVLLQELGAVVDCARFFQAVMRIKEWDVRLSQHRLAAQLMQKDHRLQEAGLYATQVCERLLFSSAHHIPCEHFNAENQQQLEEGLKIAREWNPSLNIHKYLDQFRLVCSIKESLFMQKENGVFEDVTLSNEPEHCLSYPLENKPQLHIANDVFFSLFSKDSNIKAKPYIILWESKNK